MSLRSQRGLELLEHLGTPSTKDGSRLPRDVLPKDCCRVHGRFRPEVAECRDAKQWRLAEEIAAVVTLHSAPEKRSCGDASHKSNGDKGRALPLHDIALRAVSACAIVTPSAYSRSPPTGRPRAIRETVSG